jgi:lysine 6-dehydrogenase
MDLIVLGGAGLIGSEVVRDLAATSTFSRVVVADADMPRAESLVSSLEDSRFRAFPLEVGDERALLRLIGEFPLVCNCLPFKYDTYVTEMALKAGVNGIDTTAEQLKMHERFEEAGLTFVVCCGISPGVTNMIARYALDRCDELRDVHIAFASYRALATAPGLVHTTMWEVDPQETGRVYLKDGQYHRVPPFSGPKTVHFPHPIGSQETYYVPHSEVFTIPRSFPSVRNVSVRGTWTPKVRSYLRFLHEFGFFTAGKVRVGDAMIEPMEFMERFVFSSKVLAEEEIWGFGLVVNIQAMQGGQPLTLSFYTTHPPEDAWGIPGAYSKNTGLPMSVGTQMLAAGVSTRGVVSPDMCFEASFFFNELKKRGLVLNERSGHLDLEP